jgi:hypothetical protein
MNDNTQTNPQQGEQREKNINPGQEEVRLSDSCQELLDLFYSLDFFDEQDYDNFWNAFKDFYKHADTAKQRYNIEYHIRDLDKLRVNIQTVWQKKRAAKLSAAEEQELNYGQTILLNFNSVIELVRNIKDKSEEIEGQKTLTISSKWAAQFLAGYYNVISRIGVLSHIINSMSDEIVVPERLKKNLKTQQILLNRISTQMMTLEAPDVPIEIIARVKEVSNHVQNLINFYKEQQQQKALDETEEVAQLNESHEKARLDAAILEVYKQTLDKAFSS